VAFVVGEFICEEGEIMVTEKQKANLKPPINKRPTSEQREIRRKAGIASGKSRREKKAVKEWVAQFMHEPMPAEMCEKYGLDEGTTYAAGMALKGMQGFLDGNPAMARLILELIGESKQELNINGAMPVVIHDDIK
jgi:hypothetical protein